MHSGIHESRFFLNNFHASRTHFSPYHASRINPLPPLQLALRTNYRYVQFNIDKSVESPLSRLCSQKGWNNNISHFISKCKYLAKKQYKRRHGNIARLVHWMLCGKDDLSRSEKWHHHQLHGVVETKDVRHCGIWPCSVIVLLRPDDLILLHCGITECMDRRVKRLMSTKIWRGILENYGVSDSRKFVCLLKQVEVFGSY